MYILWVIFAQIIILVYKDGEGINILQFLHPLSAHT